MNRKAFTLVELLAVIVILAIIALIVTPVVGNIITSARTSANARSVEGHIRNVELAIMTEAFTEETGDLTVYDMNDGSIPSSIEDRMPNNDSVFCMNYTIENGTVLSASDCASSVNNWDKVYSYTNTTGAKVTDSNNIVKVTYDTDGGSIDGTLSKMVIVGSTYGTLPTPTKEGYVFAGWTGKNLFNGFTVGIGLNSTTGVQTNNAGYATTDYIKVEPNTTYFLSGLASDIHSFVAAYDENYNYLGRTGGTNRTEIRVTPSSLTSQGSFDLNKVRYFRITQYYAGDDITTYQISDINNLNVQLEKGTTKTSYEPYIISSSTRVTQNTNHTLHAMWLEGSSILVTLDPNGGNVSSNLVTVTPGGKYSNLPTPTKEGYKFMGWNGKNKFNDEWLLEVPGATYTNGYYTFSFDGMYHTYGGSDNQLPITDYKENERYTITINGHVSKNQLVFASYYPNVTNGYYFMNFGPTEDDIQSGTTADLSKTIEKIKATYSSQGTAYIKHIQLEEGTTATEYEPYYITPTTTVVQSTNHTLKAIWEEKEATFLPGVEFNKKIKTLAGTDIDVSDDITLIVDYNILEVRRVNTLDITPNAENIVSTSSSDVPIYAWFNNGILYYYCELEKVYANVDAWHMFSGLYNATNIDVSTIDTSRTTRFTRMFYNDRGLEKLNLSNFDTHLATSTYGMFQYATGIKYLDLSNFDTSKITNIGAMFNSMSSLERLDISSFRLSGELTSFVHVFASTKIKNLDLSNLDVSNITETTNLLNNMAELVTLKTPSHFPTDSSVKITLPKTMYDVNGNAYTELDNTSPTNTLLFSEYTVNYDAAGGYVRKTSITVKDNVISTYLENPSKAGYTLNGWKNIIYYSETEKTRSGCSNRCEFVQYVDLAPYFDEYGVEETYHLELDIKSKDVTMNDVMQIYLQNGNTQRYHFKPNNKFLVSIKSDEWTHVSFDFQVLLTHADVEQAQLAFYGVYDSGNIPIVKNVELSILPNYIVSNRYRDIRITGNPVNLKASWQANTYNVGFDANGGVVDASDMQVTYNSTYSNLPTPTKSDATFAGWYIKYGAGLQTKFNDSNGVPIARIAPNRGYGNGLVEPGDIVEFDVTINGATITGMDFADKDLDSNLYTINGNRVSGKFVVTDNMYATTHYRRDSLTFIDIHCDVLPTSYTVNNYVVTKNTRPVQNGDRVFSDANHTLYAKWSYNVTFDANGGNLSTTSMKVTEGLTYGANGSLPTPTRSGYTFKGWNGANIYNPDTMPFTSSTHTNGTDIVSFNSGVYDRILNSSKWVPKTNTTYTIVNEIIENTFDHPLLLRTDERFYPESSCSYSGVCTISTISIGQVGTKVSTFTTKDDFSNVTIGSLWYYGSNQVTGTFKTKIAIYEGTSLTKYEPYYIKDDTIVVQNHDHVLTAIWQAN